MKDKGMFVAATVTLAASVAMVVMGIVYHNVWVAMLGALYLGVWLERVNDKRGRYVFGFTTRKRLPPN